MTNKMTTSKNKNTIIIENFQVPHYKWWDNSKAKVQIKFANDVKTILDSLNIIYKVEEYYSDKDEITTGFENIDFSQKDNQEIIECFKLENNLKLRTTECSLFIEVCKFSDCKKRGIRIKTKQNITIKKLKNYKKKLDNLIILRNEIKEKSKDMCDYLVKEVKNNPDFKDFEFFSSTDLNSKTLIEIKKDDSWFYLKINNNKVKIHDIYKTEFKPLKLGQYVEESKKIVEFLDFVKGNIVPFIEKLIR